MDGGREVRETVRNKVAVGRLWRGISWGRGRGGEKSGDRGCVGSAEAFGPSSQVHGELITPSLEWTMTFEMEGYW